MADPAMPDPVPTGFHQRLYMVRPDAYLSSYRNYPSLPMRTVTGVVQLSACRSEMEYLIDGVEYRLAAMATSPPAVVTIKPSNAKTTAFVYYPIHPLYRTICLAVRSQGYALDRESFSAFDADLQAAFEGRLGFDAAAALFDRFSNRLLQVLPTPPPLDARIARCVERLRADATLELGAAAGEIGLSGDRLSRLFKREIGLDFNRFRMSIKLTHAISLYRPGASLTDMAMQAGFADAAHLSKTFRDLLGASPTFFIEAGNIRWD